MMISNIVVTLMLSDSLLTRNRANLSSTSSLVIGMSLLAPFIGRFGVT